MTTRKINTCISTIRSVYDQNGKYLPSGNYYFIIDNINNNYVKGKIVSREINSYFVFSYIKFIRMMANAQSRLISFTDLIEEQHMPNYRFPITTHNNYFTGFSTTSEIPRIHSQLSSIIRSRYVVNYYDPLSYMRRNNVIINRPYNNNINNINNSNNFSRLNFIQRENREQHSESDPDPTPEPEKCSICWESINDSTKKTLVCNHSFHRNCVNRWLETNSSCPLCRREILNTTHIHRIRNRIRNSIMRNRILFNDTLFEEIV